MTTKIYGKNNISATIVQDSINSSGNRLTTFELEYPRFILSELNTHRMLSKNSASSRAIPIEKMHDHILKHTAMPVVWGKNRAGMQSTEALEYAEAKGAESIWISARDKAISSAQILHKLGLHKQVANRITEPWMLMKTVVTATEYANWFWLRNHKDAQPEIKELAQCMWDCLEKSVPQKLYPGEWHLPYVITRRDETGVWYSDGRGDPLTLEHAKTISASCCAQVSYRKNDDTLEKAQQIFDRLINSEPVHASPVEHQATPMSNPSALYQIRETGYNFNNPETWETGVTHMDQKYNLWSGNFKGWIQYRKTLENEAKW